ncbi:MAG: hypothetical protein OXB98_13825 [Bryobacterales bacterium]|nr:hypothetical protein [Bryobacterales bacterium]
MTHLGRELPFRPPPVRGSFKLKTSGPVSTPLDQEDASGQVVVELRGVMLVMRFPIMWSGIDV